MASIYKLVLAAGLIATLTAQGQEAVVAPVSLPSSEWQYAGYGNPKATIQTMAWAVIHTNGVAMFDSLSDDCQREFREYVAQRMPNLTAQDFLLQLWNRQLAGVSSIEILKTVDGGPDQVFLDIALKGGRNSGDRWIKVQKFGANWRVDDFDPNGPNSRTGMEHPNAEYGGIGIAVDFDAQRQVVRITNSVPDSPAAQAGLAPGTLIQKINDAPTKGKTLAECVFLLRGQVGTTVKLELYNPESKQTNTVELTRARLMP